MLRVAHVLNSPGRGGVPRVVEALVRHTDRDRIAPHAFYLKGGEGPDLFRGADIPCRSAETASKASAMTELVAFLDRYRIDILHTHSFRPNLYGRMAGLVLRPSGLKLVAHYHNDYTDKWTADAVLLEQRLAKVTDAGLAVSAPVAGHVAERVGLVCELAENAIDRDRVMGGDRMAGRIALGIGPDDVAVGLVGRVCRQKGVDTFVEAAIACLAKRPDMCFAVIGDAEDRDLQVRMTARIEAAGWPDRIRFAGHRDDIANVLAALDLLAAPSRWEGFGLMLVEAMAAGVPIVASDVGGIPDVVRHAAYLVSPDDPAALADALSRLAGNPSCRTALVEAGRGRAAHFSWDRTASRVAKVYDRIAGASCACF